MVNSTKFEKECEEDDMLSDNTNPILERYNANKKNLLIQK